MSAEVKVGCLVYPMAATRVAGRAGQKAASMVARLAVVMAD